MVPCKASPLETREKRKSGKAENVQASAHPVITVPLLHGVRVEDADDGAGLCLPELSVHVVEEQQGHEHLQVVHVIQLPDAEGFALQGGRYNMV